MLILILVLAGIYLFLAFIAAAYAELLKQDPYAAFLQALLFTPWVTAKRLYKASSVKPSEETSHG